MTYPVYIGDEATAAGFRLAGIRVYSPAATSLQETLRAAAADASLVMLSARLAQQLPANALQRLQASTSPPVVVVPDPGGDTPLPDLATRLRRELGMLE